MVIYLYGLGFIMLLNFGLLEWNYVYGIVVLWVVLIVLVLLVILVVIVLV